jgi:TPR repeat protein
MMPGPAASGFRFDYGVSSFRISTQNLMATSRLWASLQVVSLLLGVATDLYSQDISALKVQAENGSAQAQAALGNAYHLGVLLQKDEGEAAQWWQKAAEQGNVESEFNLGLV